MSRLDTINVMPNYTLRAIVVRLVVGENKRLYCNLAGYAATQGSTVSSSTWASDDTGSVAITGQTNTDLVTSALLTGCCVGSSLVTNTATLSNGERIVRQFLVGISDVENFYFHNTDYQQ